MSPLKFVKFKWSPPAHCTKSLGELSQTRGWSTLTMLDIFSKKKVVAWAAFLIRSEIHISFRDGETGDQVMYAGCHRHTCRSRDLSQPGSSSLHDLSHLCFDPGQSSRHDLGQRLPVTRSLLLVPRQVTLPRVCHSQDLSYLGWPGPFSSRDQFQRLPITCPVLPVDSLSSD